MKKRTTLIALFAVVLLLPLTAAAQTLTLTLQDGGQWSLTSGDTLRLDTLNIAYEGHKRGTLLVKEGSDTIFSEKCTNFLTKISACRFVCGKEYTFTHGSESWSVTFVNQLQQRDDTIAALKDSIATLRTHGDSPSSNDLDTKGKILLLIVLVETLLICVYPYRCSLIKFMKRVRGKFRKKVGDKAAPAGYGGSTPAAATDGTTGTVGGGAASAGATTAPTTKWHCILDKFRSLFTKKTVETPTDGKVTMTDQSQPQSESESATDDSEKDNEITRLKAEVEKYKDAAGVLAIVRERLKIEPSDRDETIITKLEAIIDSASKAIVNPSQEASSSPTQSKDEAYNDLAGELWSLADKSANDAIKDIKTEALKDKDKHQQIVTFVEKLIEAYKDLQRTKNNASTDGSKEITPEQLNQLVNWKKLVGWVIYQLSLKEYKKFDARKNNITKDDLFTEIADALKATTSESTEGANSAANSQAKEDEKPTEEQKKTVLQEIIDKINDKLSDQGQAEKTLNNNDIDTFIDEVVGALSRPADISEAEATERKANLELINKVFVSRLQDLDEQSVKNARDAWLLGKMNEKIDGLQAPNLSRLYEILRAAIESRDELKALLDSYGATTADELKKKILKKDYDDLRKSVNDKLRALIPNKPVETAEKLVRALIKVAEDGKQDIQLIVEELKEKVKAYTHADATGSTATELVDEYSRCVQQREDKLNEDIASKDKTIDDNNKVISEKEDIIAKNKEEIEKKSERINDLLSDSTTMVATLRSFAQQLGSLQSPLLDPCSGRDEPACAHANTTLTDAITTFTEKLMTFTVDGNTSPRETKRQIQEMLTSFLTDPSSAVSILCRYYAYSNLPFMSDSQRKYGVLINVSAAHEQYTLIARLYATFSITLIVPALFAHGVATTPYTALSGKASSALSFLCPQVVNHKATMDTSVSPLDVVYDIVRVGYAIDEKIQAQPEVITF